ncbi:mandelate racemase/muconate lactonizing enzyme family protein [Alterinioella nitratireducens]|uniref:mandelate racemase/muconate lactonizing enzyme family protein n=1 Tax=Alterinioella nitratireducens TaxID=2735915 RepID=UPI001551C01A|nr:mandelate racemase/muconate lactonizing enzyme family protein [Alterinioella nitratireducens]NPD18806.1 mandelate racemase/muconate lactonizing enzyme family protein [Alterinioella nitratireducens]
MIIEAVTVTPMRVPLERAFRAATFTIDVRCTLVVRIETDAGAVGEVFIGDIRDHQGEVVKIIRDDIAPRLIGLDATRLGPCYAAMIGLSSGVHHRVRVMEAISAVDTALWDLFGKITGLPVHRLLGGAQDRVRAVVSCGYMGGADDTGALTEEAAERRDEGYGGVKIKVGFSEPHVDAARARAVRDAIGPDLVLICDANQGWDRYQASEFARSVAELNVDWIEEPTHWRDYAAGMAHVRQATGQQVGAGQNEMSSEGCRDLIAAGAVDVLNFDSSLGGGVSEWVRAATLAEAHEVRIAHHEEPLVSMHLLGAKARGLYAEYFSDARDPLTPRIAPEQPPVTDGHVTVPQSAGFGITLDRDYIARYAVD